MIFEMAFFSTLHILKNHMREMSRRKVYNREKYIDVELKRTRDLLGNLFPPLVLEGIMND
jgi:hypothetical protein